VTKPRVRRPGRRAAPSATDPSPVGEALERTTEHDAGPGDQIPFPQNDVGTASVAPAAAATT
jgi:hypothetical protein